MNAAFLDFGTMGPDQLDLDSLRAAVGDLTVFDNTTVDQLSERIAGCEFVLINKVRMTREIIESADALRFIGLTATGVDNVDVQAARDNNVAVCNIRGYCTQSVVDHVFAVVLQFTRSLDHYRSSVRNGEWQNANNFCMLQFPVRELSAMTIGIVGFGELGQGVARVAAAFGMQVRVARRMGQKAVPGDERVDLHDLLQECDVVSLHCPLTDDTRGLIGEQELKLMKDDAMLINTARGGLVDSGALIDALTHGSIAAAAIDVLSQEPPVDGDQLLDYQGDNLIVTPHIAWGSIEARQNAISEIAKNVVSFLQGGDRNRIV